MTLPLFDRDNVRFNFACGLLHGAILSNLVWAELSDRLGNRSVIRLTGIVGMLIPVVALTSHFIGGSALLVVVFGLLGCLSHLLGGVSPVF